MSVRNNETAGGFQAGDEVLFDGEVYLIVDFVPATDRWGMLAEGCRALLYSGKSVYLWRVHTERLVPVVQRGSFMGGRSYEEAEGFRAGDEVLFDGEVYLIVDFVSPVTGRWGAPFKGFEALLYSGKSVYLLGVHTKCLMSAEDTEHIKHLVRHKRKIRIKELDTPTGKRYIPL